VSAAAVEPPRLLLRHRLEVAGEGLAAAAGTLAIGIAGALVIAALVLGIVLSLIWIGLPLVMAALAACQALAETHRRQANRLLGAHLPPLPAPERRGDTLWQRCRNALTDRRRWRTDAPRRSGSATTGRRWCATTISRSTSCPNTSSRHDGSAGKWSPRGNARGADASTA